MAVSTGTATDYLDLLDRLRTFMLANGWASLRFEGGSEFIAEGEGLDAAIADEVVRSKMLEEKRRAAQTF